MRNSNNDHVNVNLNMVVFVPKVNLNRTKKRSYNMIVIMCVILITIMLAIYDHSFYKGIPIIFSFHLLHNMEFADICTLLHTRVPYIYT